MFYFSGVSGKPEATYLVNNGIRHFLIDYIDYQKVKDLLPDQAEIIIDSGAYKVFKGKLKEINIAALTDCANDPRVKFVVAPDVIGDEEKTKSNWETVKGMKNIPWLPVWGSYSSESLLHEYLSEFEIVGIGALVDRLRKGYAKEYKDDKEAKKEAAVFLKYLVNITKQYPNRFHLFGVCWPKAINELMPYCYSMDSSKWITTAKKRQEILFRHSISNEIRNAPVFVAKKFSEFQETDLSCVDNRLSISISALNYFNEEKAA